MPIPHRLTRSGSFAGGAHLSQRLLSRGKAKQKSRNRISSSSAVPSPARTNTPSHPSPRARNSLLSVGGDDSLFAATDSPTDLGQDDTNPILGDDDELHDPSFVRRTREMMAGTLAEASTGSSERARHRRQLSSSSSPADTPLLRSGSRLGWLSGLRGRPSAFAGLADFDEARPPTRQTSGLGLQVEGSILGEEEDDDDSGLSSIGSSDDGTPDVRGGPTCRRWSDRRDEQPFARLFSSNHGLRDMHRPRSSPVAATQNEGVTARRPQQLMGVGSQRPQQAIRVFSEQTEGPGSRSSRPLRFEDDPRSDTAHAAQHPMSIERSSRGREAAASAALPCDGGGPPLHHDRAHPLAGDLHMAERQGQDADLSPSVPTQKEPESTPTRPQKTAPASLGIPASAPPEAASLYAEAQGGITARPHSTTTAALTPAAAAASGRRQEDQVAAETLPFQGPLWHDQADFAGTISSPDPTAALTAACAVALTSVRVTNASDAGGRSDHPANLLAKASQTGRRYIGTAAQSEAHLATSPPPASFLRHPPKASELPSTASVTAATPSSFDLLPPRRSPEPGFLASGRTTHLPPATKSAGFALERYQSRTHAARPTTSPLQRCRTRCLDRTSREDADTIRASPWSFPPARQAHDAATAGVRACVPSPTTTRSYSVRDAISPSASMSLIINATAARVSSERPSRRSSIHPPPPPCISSNVGSIAHSRKSGTASPQLDDWSDGFTGLVDLDWRMRQLAMEQRQRSLDVQRNNEGDMLHGEDSDGSERPRSFSRKSSSDAPGQRMVGLRKHLPHRISQRRRQQPDQGSGHLSPRRDSASSSSPSQIEMGTNGLSDLLTSSSSSSVPTSPLPSASTADGKVSRRSAFASSPSVAASPFGNFHLLFADDEPTQKPLSRSPDTWPNLHQSIGFESYRDNEDEDALDALTPMQHSRPPVINETLLTPNSAAAATWIDPEAPGYFPAALVQKEKKERKHSGISSIAGSFSASSIKDLSRAKRSNRPQSSGQDQDRRRSDADAQLASQPRSVFATSLSSSPSQEAESLPTFATRKLGPDPTRQGRDRSWSEGSLFLHVHAHPSSKQSSVHKVTTHPSVRDVQKATELLYGDTEDDVHAPSRIARGMADEGQQMKRHTSTTTGKNLKRSAQSLALGVRFKVLRARTKIRQSGRQAADALAGDRGGDAGLAHDYART